jgi:hypothetical protein
MFVFAIETGGKTVALTKELEPIMLDGVLSGDREEGRHLRHELLLTSGVWDGKSPFTARLATEDEALDYEEIHITAEGDNAKEIESRWYYVAGHYDAPAIAANVA